LAIKLGIEKIIIKSDTMVTYFVSNPQSDYYQSYTFTGVLKYLQHNPQKCKMKETKDKLMLTFTDAKNVGVSIKKLSDVVGSIFGN
jgi:transcription-repair coupling factor (superfamily II helicase)